MSDAIEYVPRDDHDVLVSMVTQFNNTAANIERRIAEDHASTLEVKKILEEQYSKLSDRITTLEDNFSKLDPTEIATIRTDLDGVKLWIHDFNRTKHLAWIVASVGFIFIGYYVPFFINSIISIWIHLTTLK